MIIRTVDQKLCNILGAQLIDLVGIEGNNLRVYRCVTGEQLLYSCAKNRWEHYDNPTPEQISRVETLRPRGYYKQSIHKGKSNAVSYL